jgi:poly(A) polymerase
MVGLLGRFLSLLKWLLFSLGLINNKNTKLHKPKLSRAHSYLFKNKEWVTCTQTDNNNPPSKVTIATINALSESGWMGEFLIQSNKRYAHTLKTLNKLDADVIGMNEVTAKNLKIILSQSWVRENYYVTDIPSAQETHSSNKSLYHDGKRSGSIILSKYPIDQLYMLQLPSFKYIYVMVACLFTNTDKPLTICQAHLTSKTFNVDIRKRELQILAETLTTHELLANINKENIIVMGDYNLHQDCENAMIDEIGFEDQWRPSEADKHGYTWDSHNNGTIKILFPCDNRRMRLDRIASKKGCLWTSKDGAIIFAKDSIPDSYLHGSDHYGLYAKYEF